MKRVWMAVCVTAAFSVGSAAETTAPSLIKEGQLDVTAAVGYFEDLYRSDSSIAEAELTVVRPRQERTLGMKVWTRGKEKVLVVIQSPPREKDTATLKVDKNLWNYLPRVKRTIRIPPSMMLTSWMGSDFTNDDLVRESSYTDDYTYELVGPSEDPKGWQVRFDAKPELVGLWGRMDLFLTEDGLIPIKALYYDRKGRLARTLTWEDVREFDGRRLPARMTLIPEDEKGNKTVFAYSAIDFDVDIPESTFSLSYLERER